MPGKKKGPINVIFQLFSCKESTGREPAFQEIGTLDHLMTLPGGPQNPASESSVGDGGPQAQESSMIPTEEGGFPTYTVLKPQTPPTREPHENAATSETLSLSWPSPPPSIPHSPFFMTVSHQACCCLSECYLFFIWFQIILHGLPFSLSHLLSPMKSWHPKQLTKLN